MRSARLSAALRGSMFAVALAALLSPSGRPGAQTSPSRPLPLRGAILIQTVDTSINPIAAEIVVPAFGAAVRLSEEGAALLVNVPDGLYLIQARHLGYRPEWRLARVTGDTVHLEFVLAPLDPEAGTATVTHSRLREFLARAGAIPLGSFLTRSEIERRRPRNLVALLGRVADVTVDRTDGGPPVVRSRRVLGPHCASGMLIFVDAVLPTSGARLAPEHAAAAPHERRFGHGLLTERALAAAAAFRWNGGRRSLGAARLDPPGDQAPATSSSGSAPRRTASVIERIPIATVAGVEVYPTLAAVPPEFRVTGAECGVVLVWTG